MKRLLLLLLAALALPAIAGDLGSADLVNSVFRGKHYDEYPEQTDFNYRCGGTIAVVKKCVVRFTQDRLIVDDSVGISPSQIIHFDTSEAGNVGMYLFINYLDKDGNINSAGFYSQDYKKSFTFKKAFINWMNTEK